jgi:hypothetical protein
MRIVRLAVVLIGLLWFASGVQAAPLSLRVKSSAASIGTLAA